MINNKPIGLIIRTALILIVTMGSACGRVITASREQNSQSRVQRIGSVPRGTLRYKLDFISDLVGWVANGKQLWRTIDGGKTLELVFSGETIWDGLASINQLDFADSRTGLMLSDTIYATNDGGTTWIRLSEPNAVIHSLQFSKDPKEAWAGGEMYRIVSRRIASEIPSQLVSPDGRKALYPVLFHTNDGGTHWHEQHLPSSEGRLLKVFSLDASHSWAASDGEFFYIENGSWRTVTYTAGHCSKQLLNDMFEGPDSVVYPPASLYFLDANLGWLSFQNGVVAKSADGGITWCDLLNPRDVFPTANWETYFAKLYFSDPFEGWALSANGLLYRTGDGGSSWKPIDNDIKMDDACFLDNGEAFAIGKDGLYRISRSR